MSLEGLTCPTRTPVSGFPCLFVTRALGADKMFVAIRKPETHFSGMSMRAIAKAAGVSPMTVSLALRQSGRVSRSTRERIQAIAREHGYAPNPRLREFMNEVRRSRIAGPKAAIGLISLYPEADPWRRVPHLQLSIAGAEARATELGYRLERFWLHAPGMTPHRLRTILEARAINGLLCLGSLRADEPFPRELDRCALVTMGLTIATPLHRVASHHHHDAWALLEELERRGYRRPGLIIDPEWEVRTAFGYSAMCLLFQERTLGGIQVPILRVPGWHEPEFSAWLEQHRPDVLIVNEPLPFYRALEEFLARRRTRVPRDLGVAFLGSQLTREFYAGMSQDHEQIGRCAVDMLSGRIQQRDYGFPAQPKSEFVEGKWSEGASIRPVRRRAAAGGAPVAGLSWARV